jgi:hypothetical protein
MADLTPELLFHIVKNLVDVYGNAADTLSAVPVTTLETI